MATGYPGLKSARQSPGAIRGSPEMNTKSTIWASVAMGTVLALATGVSAEAATTKHVAKKVAPVVPAVTTADVDALRAEIASLKAKLDDVSAAQAKTAADTAAVEATTDTLASSIVAQSNSINTMPATIEKSTLANLPKSLDWAKGTSVSGRMYFDVSSLTTKTAGVKQATTGTGFDVKRFYVGVDHKFNDTYSANVTMDARYNSNAVSAPTITVTPSSGTATATASAQTSSVNDVQVYLKKAYLQAKYDDRLTVRIGAADMPWIPYVEDLYGYRFVDKTLTENRFTVANSADWGVHALGKVGPWISYAVSAVNGGGYRNPTRTAGMDFEARLSAKVPTAYGNWSAAIGGYQGKIGKETQVVAPATAVAWNTAQRFDALVAFESHQIRVGAEYYNAVNWANSGVTTHYTIASAATSHLGGDKSEGTSFWGSYQFTPELSVFGKKEFVKPNKDVLFPYAAKKDNFFNIGINYEPVKIVDLALVYKRAGTDANNAPTTAPVSATYDEVGMFGQLRW